MIIIIILFLSARRQYKDPRDKENTCSVNTEAE